MAKKRVTKLCREKDCKNTQTTSGYCRLCYIKSWKKIREKQKKKAAQNLNKYIDHIMKKSPDGHVKSLKAKVSQFESFQNEAEDFMSNDDFHEMVDSLDMTQTVGKLIDQIKIDETF